MVKPSPKQKGGNSAKMYLNTFMYTSLVEGMIRSTWPTMVKIRPRMKTMKMMMIWAPVGVVRRCGGKVWWEGVTKKKGEMWKGRVRLG